jgi:hypothetical protein
VNFFDELKALTSALELHGIDYALCGGVALAIHGAPRATQDIDLLLHREDLGALVRVREELGFTLESLPMDFASGIRIQRFTKIIEGQPFMLDVLLVTPALAAIFASRLIVAFEGGRLQVVSREGLITLKLAAARPQDLVDIQRLQELSRG